MNATLRGLKCPGCGEQYTCRALVSPGTPMSHFYPSDPPEVAELCYLERNCGDSCSATDEELKDIAEEMGEIDFDRDWDYEDY